MTWELGTLLYSFGFLYWSGVIGGILMLLLFSYPIRKYYLKNRGLGKMKTWFTIHVIFGTILTVILLLHTHLFVAASLNGMFALYSIIVTVISGIIGRYLLRRVERGTLWAKLFSYWHIAHIPVIYMALFFVLIHIYAIHAY